MPKATIVDVTGKKVGDMELSEAVFGAKVNPAVLHQAVVAHLANRRQGTQSTLTRSEVRGGGKKPWRQKGTGRASFGSSRNPVWRSGGVAFGPTPRSHSITMPRKMRRLALLSALSSKALEGNVVIVEDLNFAAPKTKEMARVLNNLQAANALVILEKGNENAVLSARNLPSVNLTQPDGLNTYKVLYNEKLVLTKDALASLEEVLLHA